MDYAEDLRGLLRPLGIYDVDSGVGGAELAAVGGVLTEIFAMLETAEHESNPLTAENTGLTAWESLLPFVPFWLTQSDRRRAIAALLRIDGCGFTKAALNAAIAGCGIRAVVEERDTPMTVQVSFPYNRGEPDDFERLRWRIEQILPCHLAVEYLFIYAMWAEVESHFANWVAIEAAVGNWREIERVGGETD